MNRFLTLTTALSLIAGNAFASDLVVALPESYSGQTNILKSEMWNVFTTGVKPGESYSVLNASGERVSSISMPDDPKFNDIKRRIKTFGRENTNIGALLNSYKEGQGTSDIDIPKVLRSFGDHRTEPDNVTDLLIIGNLVHFSEDEPHFSWRDSNGAFQIPTTEHLYESLKVSEWGTKGREFSLNNTYVHVCAVNKDKDWNSAFSESSHEFLSLFIQKLGGTLVTFADNDTNSCFHRFKNRARNIPKEFTLQKSGKGLAMVKVSRNSVKELEPGRKLLSEIDIDEFNVFVDENHRWLSGVKVVTGIKYHAKNYPRKFVNSWCYFNRNVGGAVVKIDVGRMDFNGKPVWREPSNGTLNSAKISRTNVIAARESCQFPISE